MKRTLKSRDSAQEPIAKRQKSFSTFGKFEGQNRGENLIDPPIKKEDYYGWMRDETRSDKDVLEYLEKENIYTDKMMKDTIPLQEKLFEEIKSRTNETSETYPYLKGIEGTYSKYRYFQKIVGGNSYPFYCRKNLGNSSTELLLDINELAKDKDNCDVINVNVSPSHNILAYGIDYSGDEKYDLVLKNIKTDKVIEHAIGKIPYGSYDWHPNSHEIFYTLGDESSRIDQLWNYNLRTKENILIFKEDDINYEITFEISQDNKFIFVTSASGSITKTY